MRTPLDIDGYEMTALEDSGPSVSTWIALLRGVNVGGKNRLPMKELVQDLLSLGLEDVRTYIQSGNVVFRAATGDPGELATQIAALVQAQHGFEPDVLVLEADTLRDAMDANPFPEATDDPKTLHLYFCASAPTEPDLDSLEAAKSGPERFHLAENVLYLHAPDGIGRSKLAASVERCLGVRATARNWRTVEKLREMAGPN